MKIIIFSDIHGNQYAFNKFLTMLKEIKYDYIIFLGDIFGYYYGQKKIVKKMKKISKLLILRGNHDQNFLNFIEQKIRPNKKFTKKYGISYNRNLKKNGLYRFLKKSKIFLEMKIENKKLFFCHGDIENYLNGYKYPDGNFEVYKDLDYDYIFLGNTHYKMDKKLTNTQILNPGSLGQPRDDGNSSFILLDLEKEILKFIKIDYNSRKLKYEIIRKKEQEKYLFKVLSRRKN